MKLKPTQTFKARLLLLGAIAGIFPVIVISLSVWLLGMHLTADLEQQLAAIQAEKLQHLQTHVNALRLETVRRKALEVARQVDFYLAANHRCTLMELCRDAEFRQLVIQPVGKSGYTWLIERCRRIVLFHPEPALEGKSLEAMAREIPQAVEIARQQEGASCAEGYCAQPGPDGQGRRKFVFFAPIQTAPRDDIRLLVGATAYLDEAEHPVYAISETLKGTLGAAAKILATRLTHFNNIILVILSVSALVGMLGSVLLARRLTRGVTQLTAAAQAFDRGELSYRIASPGQDELGQLARTLNHMADTLQETMISRAEWEGTFNANSDRIFLLDTASRVTSLNQAAAEFLGMCPAAAWGQPCYKLVHHTDQPPDFCPFQQTLRTGVRSECEFQAKDWGQVWRITTDPLYNEERQLIGGVCVIRNITVLKQAQAELAQAMRFLHDVLEGSPLAITVVDQTGHFTYVNPQVQKEFGYMSQELLGQHYSRLYAHEEERREITAELRNRGEVLCRLVRIRHQDGRTCPARLSIRKLVGPEGQVLGSVALSRNISEEENLLRQLEQAQKLEAIAAMAGGLAHNFNNLLMIILGLSNLMLSKTEEARPFQMELQEIVRQVQAGSEITRQLLALARETPFTARPVNLNEVVTQTANIFARTHKELQLHQSLAPAGTIVEADPGQIQQVLMNLLVNAWQAMPEGGEIFLETDQVTFSPDDVLPPGAKPGSYARLTVRDTGVGMDEETQAHIFEPFFTTKGPGQGTGLGLATVYRIIKNHQGIIEVSSTKGQGTTFCLYLPNSDRLPQKTAFADKQLIYGQGIILLVDDESMLRQVADKMLTHLGYQVLQAADGAQALEIYRDKGHLIDLVILDLVMPGLSGQQTYEHLKALNPAIKVLFSSGYGEAEMAEGTDAGFIPKPYTLETLSQKVAAILQA